MVTAFYLAEGMDVWLNSRGISFFLPCISFIHPSVIKHTIVAYEPNHT